MSSSDEETVYHDAISTDADQIPTTDANNADKALNIAEIKKRIENRSPFPETTKSCSLINKPGHVPGKVAQLAGQFDCHGTSMQQNEQVKQAEILRNQGNVINKHRGSPVLIEKNRASPVLVEHDQNFHEPLHGCKAETVERNDTVPQQIPPVTGTQAAENVAKHVAADGHDFTFIDRSLTSPTEDKSVDIGYEVKEENIYDAVHCDSLKENIHAPGFEVVNSRQLFDQGNQLVASGSKQGRVLANEVNYEWKRREAKKKSKALKRPTNSGIVY